MPAERTLSGEKARSHVGVVSRAGAVYPRKKASAACQVCRARRTRCDNDRPCSFCVKTGATCVSEPSDLAGFDPGTLKILERLEELQTTINSFAAGTHQAPAATITHHQQSQDVTDSQPKTTSAPKPTSLVPETLEALLRWRVWNDLQPPSTPSCIAGSVGTPASDHALGGIDADFDISAHQAYLDSFFTNVHVKNPVLDEALIRSRVRSVSLNGLTWDADSCLILLILANGAVEAPFNPDYQDVSGKTPTYRIGLALFAAAQKRIGALLQAGFLVQAQCSLYSGVFLMSVLQPFNAWRMFLQGLASCQAFASLTTAGDNPTHSQAEESVYWSCWKSEREIRLELGLPDFTTAGVDHPQMFPSLPHGCEGDQLRAWYFYLAEISLWRIETSARKAIAQFDPGQSLEDLARHVESLEEPVVSWKDSLPPAIHIDVGFQENEHDMIRFVLQGRLTYNYEVLTWPFVYAIINEGQAGPLSTKLGIKGLQMHHDRLITNSPGFRHRHHGTWLMQRSSARSACILIAAGRMLPPEWLPQGWRNAVWSTIQMLDYWRHNSSGLGDVADFMRQVMASIAN